MILPSAEQKTEAAALTKRSSSAGKSRASAQARVPPASRQSHLIECVWKSEMPLAKKKKQGVVNPTRLSAFDEDKKVQVIIETPKGSRNKYAWDPEQQIFALKKVLPESKASSRRRARRNAMTGCSP
jgi:hypothetical protein